MMPRKTAMLKTRRGRSVEYVSDSCFAVGDYCGAGAIGEANIRTIVDTVGEDFVFYTGDNFENVDISAAGYPRVIIETEFPGYRHAWIRADVASFHDLHVDDYPILDDSTHDAVLEEWKSDWMSDQHLIRDMFDSILKRELSDIERHILCQDADPEHIETVRDWLDELPDVESMADAWYSLESFACERGSNGVEWLDEGTTSLCASSASCEDVCRYFADWVADQPRKAAVAAGQMEIEGI